MSDAAAACRHPMPPITTLRMHRIRVKQLKQMQQMTLLLEYLESWYKMHPPLMGIFLEFLSDLKFKKLFYDVIASISYSNGGFEGDMCPLL